MKTSRYIFLATGVTLGVGLIFRKLRVLFPILVLIFFMTNGHIGLVLIQLEVLSLFVLSLLLFFEQRRTSPLFLFLLFCVIATEAAIALSLLVVNSRNATCELEKLYF